MAEAEISVPVGWQVSQSGGSILLASDPADPGAPSVLLKTVPTRSADSLERLLRGQLARIAPVLGEGYRVAAEVDLGSAKVWVVDMTRSKRPARVVVSAFLTRRKDAAAVSLLAAPPQDFAALHAVALGSQLAAQAAGSAARISGKDPVFSEDEVRSGRLVRVIRFARNRPLSAADEALLARQAEIAWSALETSQRDAMEQLLADMDRRILAAERSGFVGPLRNHLLEFWLASARAQPLDPMVPALLELLPRPNKASHAPTSRLAPDVSASRDLEEMISKASTTALAIRLDQDPNHGFLQDLWSVLERSQPETAKRLQSQVEEQGLSGKPVLGALLSVSGRKSVLQLLGPDDPSFAPSDAPLTLRLRELDQALARSFSSLAEAVHSVVWRLEPGQPVCFAATLHFADPQQALAATGLMQWLSIPGLHAQDPATRDFWRRVTWSRTETTVSFRLSLTADQERALIEGLVHQLATDRLASGNRVIGESELAAWALQQWVEKNLILFGHPAGYRPF